MAAAAPARTRTVTAVVQMRAQDIQAGDAVPYKSYRGGRWEESGWTRVERVERQGRNVVLHSADCTGRGMHDQPCNGSGYQGALGCRSDNELGLVQVQVPTEIAL